MSSRLIGSSWVPSEDAQEIAAQAGAQRFRRILQLLRSDVAAIRPAVNGGSCAAGDRGVRAAEDCGVWNGGAAAAAA
ncbi:hypothetical protein GCM10029978_109700 [Actinoallomurus acanthiterrae]